LADVNLAVTGRCPLRCPCCYRTAGGDELSLSAVIATLDQLPALGTKTLYLGGGEPLSRADLPDIMRHAASLGLRIYLATNGVLVTPRVIEWLKEIPPDLVFVGLEDPAATGPTEKDQTGYRSAVHGVKLLVDAGFPIAANHIITAENAGRLAASLFGYLAMGISRVNLIRAKPSAEPGWYESRRLSSHHLLALKSTVPDLANRLGVNISFDCSLTPLLHGTPAFVFVHRRTYLCPAGMNYLRIEPNGDVFPCPLFRDRIEPLGRVPRDKLEDIWHRAPLLTELRQNRPPRGRCGECYLGARCGGCRAIALHETGDIHAEDPACPFGPRLISR